MLNTHRMISAVLLTAGLLGNAVAEDMKLGYVNAVRVYSESQIAKRIEAKLEQEFGERRQKLREMQQNLVELGKQLSSERSNPAEQSSLQGKFDELKHQHRIETGRLLEDYNLRRNEEFASLQYNANLIVHDIAEKEKFDLIVQEAVFVRGKYDITDHVIKRLDEGQ